MENIRFVLAGIGIALLLVAGSANADIATIQALVRITMDLDQHPTEEEKGILKAIIDSDDSSEEEAAIAMALSNMQGKVTGGDAERLQDIVDDDFSDDVARRLAGILLRIEHEPGDKDRVALAALAGE
ncbi:MAG: hypothetical protein OEM30_09195 [Gammaproteobacteria bacterium]|jgi:hypothetical protein|nr:hypothetical protein [Gammaproteobacteria bacterium]